MGKSSFFFFFFEVVGGIVLEGFDNGSCNCWEVQAGEEDWEWLIWRALFRYCLHSMLLLSFLCFFFFNNIVFFVVVVGVNVQTGEEVAVKLVCDVCFSSSFFVYDPLLWIFVSLLYI